MGVMCNTYLGQLVWQLTIRHIGLVCTGYISPFSLGLPPAGFPKKKTQGHQEHNTSGQVPGLWSLHRALCKTMHSHSSAETRLVWPSSPARGQLTLGWKDCNLWQLFVLGHGRTKNVRVRGPQNGVPPPLETLLQGRQSQRAIQENLGSGNQLSTIHAISLAFPSCVDQTALRWICKVNQIAESPHWKSKNHME